ncbi:MAG: hypothetical protein ACLUR5_03355 [Eubacterium ventriosum]
MQTEVEESETVNTDNDVETVNEKQNDNQEKATESKPDSTEDSRDVIEDETEETIKEVNPTKYSSATVTIHRVSNGKVQPPMHLLRFSVLRIMGKAMKLLNNSRV